METATIGHNHAPAHLEFVEQADNLKETAKGFLDGSPISSDAEAQMVAKLIDEAVKLDKSADKARKAVTEPLDAQKKAVMADFKPVVGTCELIKSAGKKAQTVWLNKLAAEKAERERIERERLAKEREALQASIKAAESLEDVEARNKAIEDQLRAEAALERSQKETVKVSGGGRAISMRTVYDVAIISEVELSRWFWANRRDDLIAWMTDEARKQVRASSGNATIDGIKVLSERVAV